MVGYSDSSNEDWWDYDKFLSPIMKENMKVFDQCADLNGNILSALLLFTAKSKSDFSALK